MQNEIIQPETVWETAEVEDTHLYQAVQQQVINYLSAYSLSAAGMMLKRDKRNIFFCGLLLASADCR